MRRISFLFLSAFLWCSYCAASSKPLFENLLHRNAANIPEELAARYRLVQAKKFRLSYGPCIENQGEEDYIKDNAWHLIEHRRILPNKIFYSDFQSFDDALHFVEVLNSIQARYEVSFGEEVPGYFTLIVIKTPDHNGEMQQLIYDEDGIFTLEQLAARIKTSRKKDHANKSCPSWKDFWR